jgi:hypothetical protein
MVSESRSEWHPEWCRSHTRNHARNCIRNGVGMSLGMQARQLPNLYSVSGMMPCFAHILRVNGILAFLVPSSSKQVRKTFCCFSSTLDTDARHPQKPTSRVHFFQVICGMKQMRPTSLEVAERGSWWATGAGSRCSGDSALAAVLAACFSCFPVFLTAAGTLFLGGGSSTSEPLTSVLL